MDYHTAFQDAVQNFVAGYETGHWNLMSSGDLQACLFAYCVDVLTQNQDTVPFRLHSSFFLSARDQVDLMLGEPDLISLVLLEPDFPEMNPLDKPYVFTDDVERAGQRIQSFCDQYAVPHGYLILLDEDGRHLRTQPSVSWHKLDNGSKEAYLMMKHFEPSGS